MTLSMKLGGAWKEAQSLHVKIAGEWKDVSTLYSKKDGAWVTVYSSGALIEFVDYPFPIPVAQGWKYSTDGKVWTKVEADGELNTDGGMFTGFVKANEITLSEYSTDVIPGETGLRIDGEVLSVGRNELISFINGEKGYVCGGFSGSVSAVVDVYDSSGNRTTGTSLSVARYDGLTSFVHGSKGYVCGGLSSTYESTVDIYDSSGNRTSGTPLSVARSKLISFVNNSKGYVCGGHISSGGSSTVDVYDDSGNRTTGTSLSVGRYNSTSFVNNSKGYVCGGSTGSVSAVVDVYDSSGNRTAGHDLSVGRRDLTSFTNNSKGYVCGGSTGSVSAVVDVYDSSGTITTGTSLSASRSLLTSFVNNSKGYVCGGAGNASSDGATVDIYDSSGTRTTGTSLSVARRQMTSFVNNSKGYVCGGYSSSYESIVDIYYDQPESYSTKLPITEGSIYTLNGESGVANVSKVMEFDSKVSGTIKYKEGDLLPGVKITVVDESGNVVEGATISIISSDWDLSNMTATYTWYSFKGESIMTLTLGGIIGSFPECTKLKVVFVLGNNTYPYDPDGNEFVTIEDNNPNITLSDWGLSNINGNFPDSVKVTLYDANDKVIEEGTANCVNVS